jgi:hypothetical protein
MYEVCKDVADPISAACSAAGMSLPYFNQPVAQADDCVEGAVENEVWQERHATMRAAMLVHPSVSRWIATGSSRISSCSTLAAIHRPAMALQPLVDVGSVPISDEMVEPL